MNSSAPTDPPAPDDQPAEATPPPHKPRRRGRRVKQAGWGLFISFWILLAAAPTIFQFDPWRSWLLSAAVPGLNGSISADSANFGWFSPVHVSQLVIRDASGATVVEAPEIHFDTTLWTLLTGGQDLGRLRLRDPRINVVVDAKGQTNLRQVFGNMRRRGNLVDQLRGRTLDLELTDLRIHVRTHDSAGDWRAGNINFIGRIEPKPGSDSTSPVLLVRPCKLLDRTELTPGLCNDVLRYVLPPLAGATATEGAVSIDLQAGTIPLEQPRSLTLDGAVTIHDVAIGPGAITQSMSDLLATIQAPSRFQLADNSVVLFHIQDEKVTHEGLRFGVPQVQVRTAGTVGFDQTLDVNAELILALPADEKRPILSALGNQNIMVPIRGTFAEPKIEIGEMASGNANWLKMMQTAGSLWAKRREAQGAATETDPATSESTDPAAGFDATDVLDDLPVGNGEILDWWAERRKQREAERKAAAEQQPATGSGTPEPRRRRIFDRLRGRAETPPAPPTPDA